MIGDREGRRPGAAAGRRARSEEELEREIASLAELGRDELAERWRSLCGGDPPRSVSRELLAQLVAYRMQARRWGGLRPALRRQMRQAAGACRSGAADGSSASTYKGSARPTPGTRLVREWNGATYVVDVTEKGYLFAGKTYRSLSQIARRITGSRWSGPRFFGIAGPKGSR